MSETGKHVNVALVSFCDEFAVGIRSLVAYGEKFGHSFKVFLLGRYTGLAQLPPPADLDLLISIFEQDPPDVIGIGVRSFYRNTAFNLAQRIKAELPQTKIVFGGIHASIMPEECIEVGDAVCLGEGEEALVEYLDMIKDDTPPSPIEGMWIKQGDGVIKSGFRKPIRDLDQIPVPDFNKGRIFLIENRHCEPYNRVPTGKFSQFGIRKYNIITSRGCNFSCSYCVNSFFHENYPDGKVVRQRSIDHVMTELHRIADQVELIDFQDDDFLMNKEWVNAFIARYKKEIDLPFTCLATPTYIRDENYLQSLREAGLFSINIGIQSGSKNTQKIFKRSFNRENIVDISNKLIKVHVLPQYDVILNNPFEGRDDVHATLDLLLDLKRPFRLNLFSLTFFPKYPITNQALDSHLIKEAGEGYTKLEDANGNYASDFDLNNLIYLSQVNFFPKSLIRMMAKTFFIEKNTRITKTLVRISQYTIGSKLFYMLLILFWNIPMVSKTVKRLLIKNRT